MLRQALIALALTASPALAFDRVAERAAFLSVVEGKTLAAFAVRLTVMADGTLSGRAFGRDVTGTWTWEDGFFCRTLDAGDRQFPRNCQLVELDGTTLRFTADRGEGDIADLRLR
jgi:hypothetical protein